VERHLIMFRRRNVQVVVMVLQLKKERIVGKLKEKNEAIIDGDEGCSQPYSSF
jgi:hypothetical protein